VLFLQEQVEQHFAGAIFLPVRLFLAIGNLAGAIFLISGNFEVDVPLV